MDKVIDAGFDNPELKLATIIELLSSYDADLDATIAVLKWQKQVVHKFYQAPH